MGYNSVHSMGETMGIFWILIVGLLQFIVVGGSDLRYELPARSLQSVEAKKDPPCIPIEGKTAIVIGQDYESISNYTAAFTSNTQPFGLMAYTALRNQYGDLAGLMNPIDYGSGIEWAQGLMEKYPSSSIQLGIWLVDQLELVVHGQLDAPIHSLIQFVNQSSTTPFYIRLGYEFDSVENNYNPNVYQQMFQYVVKKVCSEVYNPLLLDAKTCLPFSFEMPKYPMHTLCGMPPDSNRVITSLLQTGFLGNSMSIGAGCRSFSSPTNARAALPALSR